MKYTHKQWAQKMVDQGSVRVGTLYEYKTFEGLGGGVYDSNEGVRRLGLVDVPGMSWMPSNTAKVKYLRDRVGIELENCFDTVVEANREDHARDVYIYSISGELSRDCAAACHESYDSVVMIWDVMDLIKRVNANLANCARFLGLSSVKYIDGYASFDAVGHIPPDRIKAARFAPQKEFRAVWAPVSDPLIPQILTLGPLQDICSCLPLSALDDYVTLK